MKHKVTRRKAIAGGTAVLAGMACAGPVIAKSTSHFSPPSGPMQLTRKLFRYLSDGEQIVATRSWTVRFTPVASGYQAQGKQSDCKVDAPPSLAVFARMEEMRIEESFLPLLISKSGIIISIGTADANAMRVANDPDRSRQFVDSVEVAQRYIEGAHISLAEERAASAFLQNLRQGKVLGLNHMPGDLFFPQKTEFDKTATMPLPEDQSGTVRIQQHASLEANGRYMDDYQREVSTDFGDKVSRSREEWALQPLRKISTKQADQAQVGQTQGDPIQDGQVPESGI